MKLPGMDVRGWRGRFWTAFGAAVVLQFLALDWLYFDFATQFPVLTPSLFRGSMLVASMGVWFPAVAVIRRYPVGGVYLWGLLGPGVGAFVFVGMMALVYGTGGVILGYLGAVVVVSSLWLPWGVSFLVAWVVRLIGHGQANRERIRREWELSIAPMRRDEGESGERVGGRSGDRLSEEQS